MEIEHVRRIDAKRACPSHHIIPRLALVKRPFAFQSAHARDIQRDIDRLRLWINARLPDDF